MMNSTPENHDKVISEEKIGTLLEWCSSAVGPCIITSEDERFHGRSSVYPIKSPSGRYYLKVHQEKTVWEGEVHGYEQWAKVFDPFVPPLIAIHEEGPYALLLGELAGESLEKVELTPKQEGVVWHTAGKALAKLHNLDQGQYFGRCTREGLCAEEPVSNAIDYVSVKLEEQTGKAVHAGYLDREECAVIERVKELIPAFAGESPIPCHRDYCPANWLVTGDGEWTGVIDFEMSFWDVRVADFSRYPNWEWMHSPALIEAFFEGYGRQLSQKEEQQCLVAFTDYALGAIVWGQEHSYFGFVEEGRQSLRHIAETLS